MKSDSVTFVPAKPEDERFLFQVYTGTRESEMSYLPWDGKEKSAFLEMQHAAQDKHYRSFYRGCLFLKVLWDESPAGRLYLYRQEKKDRIVDISMLPPFRNRGIGTRVLETVILDAARAGKSLWAQVEKNNPAFDLYLRLGFECVEDLGLYWSIAHHCRSESVHKKSSSL